MRLLRRGDAAYEEARRAAVWDARVPERFPDLIAIAEVEADLVEALGIACERGLKVGVRSGGHSWSGNRVRDGGILLDVSRLDGVAVDADSMRAAVGPGAHGDALLTALDAQELFFPVGHCPGVGLGGYLLQGGFGWKGRVHGPACVSVGAIDVCTAAGELVRADEPNHPDLFWAARGSGPGFFGAVSRFHLRLYRRPKVKAMGLINCSAEHFDDLFAWAAEIGPGVPRGMELMLQVHRDAVGELEITVAAAVLVETTEEAVDALGLLDTYPARRSAREAMPYAEVGLAELFRLAAQAYPDRHRYAADNMWTHSPIEDLLPGLKRIGETRPGGPSHMLWMNWGASPPRPDMAYSLEDETYIALYAVWSDPAEDAGQIGWATERMAEMAALASGVQLADENLARRPARFVSDQSLRRLDEVLARSGPEGLFHPWMGRL